LNRLAWTNNGVTTGGAGDLDAAAVQAALTRVLASESFAASERLRRLLRFLVDEALAGRGNRLKGYRIAVEVFNRDEEFDADTDPLVRIQAGRLRRALDRYYGGDGARDPVRISVPKGGYTPVFQLASQTGQVATSESPALD
jgi:adenylate cyclase